MVRNAISEEDLTASDVGKALLVEFLPGRRREVTVAMVVECPKGRLILFESKRSALDSFDRNYDPYAEQCGALRAFMESARSRRDDIMNRMPTIPAFTHAYGVEQNTVEEE